MKTATVSQAAGSAYAEVGGTKVLCAVYGPRQLAATEAEFSTNGKLRCEYKEASFARPANRRRNRIDIQDRHGRQAQVTKEATMLITQALEQCILLSKYPKSAIDIHVFVLESDGGALSTAVTCASLALADAGIELLDMVAACTVVRKGDKIMIDPSHEEEDSADASLLVAFMPSLDEVTHLFQRGSMEQSQVLEGIELCMSGSSKVHGLMGAHLLAKAALS